MTEFSQEPEWWQGPDGTWYPPASPEPDTRPAPPTSYAPAPAAASPPEPQQALYQPHPPAFQQPTHQVADRAPQAAPPGKSRIPKVLGGVVAVLVMTLIGAVGYLVGRNGGGEIVKPTTPTTEAVDDTQPNPSGPNPSGPNPSEPPETEPPDDAGELTAAQQKAADKAQERLDRGPISRESLLVLIGDDGDATMEDTAIGIDSLNVDWNEQAALEAREVLEMYPYSRQGLINDMSGWVGYTRAEATYGVDSLDTDWNDQAVKYAETEKKTFEFMTCEETVGHIMTQGEFNAAEARHGADAVGAC